MSARARLGRSDLPALAARSGAALSAALGVVSENVLHDCSAHVPVLTGDLRASGEAHPAGEGRAEVTWGRDAKTGAYARAQYYGVGLNHDTPANKAAGGQAAHHWFEAARSRRAEAWRGMAASEYARRL